MGKYVLVVGGAGYIGSHANKVLASKGYSTVILDNLDYGHKNFVKWGEFILGDSNDTGLLRLIFSKYNIEAVMHFAAFSCVGESVDNPEKYYINNVANTLNILKVMREFFCNKFIFSSTCAIYGNPVNIPMDENHPRDPVNPYGRSKLMVENILQDYSQAYGFKFVSLRYFNAAGADIDKEIGEQHDPETHLIPLILEAALGKRPEIKVYGVDYNTRDGSAIRDYIHVLDLAQAHLLAFEYLNRGGESDVFNLSNGKGYSVLEVIDAVKKVTGKNFKVILDERRSGDPAVLIGDSAKATQILNWKPEYFQLDTIIESAWNWINV